MLTYNIALNRSLWERKFINFSQFIDFFDFTAGNNDKKMYENDEGSRNSGYLVGQKVKNLFMCKGEFIKKICNKYTYTRCLDYRKLR